jgi:hypothetical protein
MEIKIKSATVLLTLGTDKVILNTEMPCPFVKEALPSQPCLTLTFDATYNTGVDYCKNQFNIVPNIIDVR